MNLLLGGKIHNGGFYLNSDIDPNFVVRNIVIVIHRWKRNFNAKKNLIALYAQNDQEQKY